MQHIGMIIRQKRREKKLSAEFIAKQLKNPITKQAFTQKERNGHFSYEMVREVAKILNCNIDEFHSKASLPENIEPPV